MYKIPAIGRAIIRKRKEQCVGCMQKKHQGDNYCYMWRSEKDIPVCCGYRDVEITNAKT